MRRYTKLLIAGILVCFLTACNGGNEAKGDGTAPAAGGDTSYFFGARVIPGDGSPVLEDQAIIVTNGKITTIGNRKDVFAPKTGARIDLTGRTVTPVFINLQAQPGMNNANQYGPKNYSRDSVIADLSRYAYYGVMAVMSAGTDAGDLASSVRSEVREGKVKAAQLFTAGRGIAATGGGPAGLGETTIHVNSANDAKRAVTDLASQKVDVIKLWMDDGNGKGARLKTDAFTAAIDEAHKRSLKVVAEVFDLDDAKDLVKAGVDGFVNSIRDREVDDALISAMKEKNVLLAPALTANEAKFVYADEPDWLGEQTMREVYPAKLVGYLKESVIINKFKRNPELAALRQQYATALKNVKKVSAAGVKVALGTNSGAADTYPGYFELREMIAMADAGMQPMDVIKAATSVPAAFLGLSDMGVLAVGKKADFLSMPNNPLEKMSNIKDIGVLYLNGSEQERSALIQNITINVETLKITAKDRQADAAAEAEARRQAEDAKLKHYGDFPLGKAQSFRGLSVPTPKYSTASVTIGPPDRVSVSMKGSAAQLRAFYAAALPAYNWKPAGGCWEKESASKKTETLCVEASNNSAVITVTEK